MQKFSLFIIFIIFFSCLGFAQDEEISQAEKDIQKTHTEVKKSIGENLKEVIEIAEKNSAGKNTKETALISPEEAQAWALKANPNIDPKVLRKLKLHEALKIGLAPLRQIPEEDLKNQLNIGLKNSPSAPYIKNHPKILQFMVSAIKDENAIPSAAVILENRDRVMIYGAVMILSILFGLVLKRIFYSHDANILVSLLAFMVRLAIMFAIRLYITYWFYGKELTPLFQVFKKTFISSF